MKKSGLPGGRFHFRPFPEGVSFWSRLVTYSRQRHFRRYTKPACMSLPSRISSECWLIHISRALVLRRVAGSHRFAKANAGRITICRATACATLGLFFADEQAPAKMQVIKATNEKLASRAPVHLVELCATRSVVYSPLTTDDTDSMD
jgi:hypothetical protein